MNRFTAEDISHFIIPFILAFYATYYFIFGRSRPQIFAKKSALGDFFIKYCPVLSEVYSPPIWSFTGRLQTLIRPIFKKNITITYTNEHLHLPDGGEIMLSWYQVSDEKCHKNTPIVLILPGLTGCSCSSYIVHLVKSIAKHGHRCVVFNNRGTCTQKIKTPRTYCAGDIRDISCVVEHLVACYPSAPIAAVGVSLGGIVLFQYLSSFSAEPEVEPACRGRRECPLQAVVIISVVWDLVKSAKSLERPLDWFLFNLPLTHLLHRLVNNNADILSLHYDVPRILKGRTLRDFDENMTIRMFGFTSVEEYYTKASPVFLLNKIKTPVLCFSAADDPFVPIESLPLRGVSESSHIVLALTKYGGHIGFLDSLLPTGANLMDRVVEQFCCAVFKHLPELRASLQATAH